MAFNTPPSQCGDMKLPERYFLAGEIDPTTLLCTITVDNKQATCDWPLLSCLGSVQDQEGNK